MYVRNSDVTEDKNYQQRVLVVDDDADLAEITADCLTDLGLNVQTVFTVPNAKQELSERSYDYLITDLTMPHGGGMELISWLKSKIPQDEFGIVIVSGQLDFDPAELNGTPVELLPKPFSRQQLMEVCNRMKKFQRGNLGA
jgi:DNA-binding NtrC family response regulator